MQEIIRMDWGGLAATVTAFAALVGGLITFLIKSFKSKQQLVGLGAIIDLTQKARTLCVEAESIYKTQSNAQELKLQYVVTKLYEYCVEKEYVQYGVDNAKLIEIVEGIMTGYNNLLVAKGLKKATEKILIQNGGYIDPNEYKELADKDGIVVRDKKLKDKENELFNSQQSEIQKLKAELARAELERQDATQKLELFNKLQTQKFDEKFEKEVNARIGQAIQSDTPRVAIDTSIQALANSQTQEISPKQKNIYTSHIEELEDEIQRLRAAR